MRRAIFTFTMLCIYHLAAGQLFHDIDKKEVTTTDTIRYRKGWVLAGNIGVVSSYASSMKFTKVTREFASPDFSGPAMQSSMAGNSIPGKGYGTSMDISAHHSFGKLSAGVVLGTMGFTNIQYFGGTERKGYVINRTVFSAISISARYGVLLNTHTRLLMGLKAGYPLELASTFATKRNISKSRYTCAAELGFSEQVNPHLSFAFTLGLNMLFYSYDGFSLPVSYYAEESQIYGTSAIWSYDVSANKGLRQKNVILDSKIALYYHLYKKTK